MSHKDRMRLVEKDNPDISITRQAELLQISRSSIYYLPIINREDIILKIKILKLHERYIFYGSRRIVVALIRKGFQIGRTRTSRLMRELGIKAIYPKPRITIPNRQHKKYPYLLRGVKILKVNQVWSSDITYIRIKGGWIYLTVIMDWHSRYVISWESSITLEEDFCVKALNRALKTDKPEIFNSDQGSQYTSNDFIGTLEKEGIKISMDGKGRCLDNILNERLWRSVKYEDVYLKDYETVFEAYQELKKYFEFYNNERPHQSLGYKTPAEVYFDKS